MTEQTLTDTHIDDLVYETAMSLTYRDESAIKNLRASDVREWARFRFHRDIPWSDTVLQVWLENYNA